MNLILSIKPKYVKHILDGTKKFEFRKTIFKQKVDKVYIYSSSPVMQIVASFKVEDILTDNISILWDKCHKYSGISKLEYEQYFSTKPTGYAIEITDLDIFSKAIYPKTVIENFRAPQSFMYYDGNIEHLPKL